MIHLEKAITDTMDLNIPLGALKAEVIIVLTEYSSYSEDEEVYVKAIGYLESLEARDLPEGFSINRFISSVEAEVAQEKLKNSKELYRPVFDNELYYSLADGIAETASDVFVHLHVLGRPYEKRPDSVEQTQAALKINAEKIQGDKRRALFLESVASVSDGAIDSLTNEMPAAGLVRHAVADGVRKKFTGLLNVNFNIQY